MRSVTAFDASLYARGTVAASGRCSWHGTSCPDTPVVSFVDEQGKRQSGCERAAREIDAAMAFAQSVLR